MRQGSFFIKYSIAWVVIFSLQSFLYILFILYVFLYQKIKLNVSKSKNRFFIRPWIKSMARRRKPQHSIPFRFNIFTTSAFRHSWAVRIRVAHSRHNSFSRMCLNWNGAQAQCESGNKQATYNKQTNKPRYSNASSKLLLKIDEIKFNLYSVMGSYRSLIGF